MSVTIHTTGLLNVDQSHLDDSYNHEGTVPKFLTVPYIDIDKGEYAGLEIVRPLEMLLDPDIIERLVRIKDKFAPESTRVEVGLNGNGYACERYSRGNDTVLYVESLPEGITICAKPSNMDMTDLGQGYFSGTIWILVDDYTVVNQSALNDFLSEFGDTDVFCEKAGGQNIAEDCIQIGPREIKIKVVRNEIIVPNGLFEDPIRIPLYDFVQAIRGLSSVNSETLKGLSEEQILGIVKNYDIFKFDDPETKDKFLKALKALGDFVAQIGQTKPPTATPIATRTPFSVPVTSTTTSIPTEMPTTNQPPKDSDGSLGKTAIGVAITIAVLGTILLQRIFQKH